MNRNFVDDYRQRRGMGVSELAMRVGVTRQTIYSIEAGNYVPNTVVALRMGQTLGVSVEELFPLDDDVTPFTYPEENALLLPSSQPPYEGQPVQLCQVGRNLIAASPEASGWSLPPADGVLVGVSDKRKKDMVRVRPFCDTKDLGKRILVAGCDPGISVLARHLQRAGIELIVVNRNSTKALELLKAGLVHVAGCHLRDPDTGESNLPVVHRYFDKRTVAVVGFCIWEEGIAVARGNPKHIEGFADFARPDVTIVNREDGAGCRMMLDHGLTEAGVSAKKVKGYDQIAQGHLPVAWHVQNGKADCGIVTRAAAKVFGLDFIPLLQERYDLVMRKSHLSMPEFQELLEILGRASFRRELEGLGGYDTRTAGNRFA